MANALPLIKKYTELVGSNLSFIEIKNMPIYPEIEKLGERMASEYSVTDELSFKVENTIMILTKLNNRRTFILPYWTSEVVEYYLENPPRDYTNYFLKEI